MIEEGKKQKGGHNSPPETKRPPAPKGMTGYQNKDDKLLFVVIMNRWGDDERHSYCVGVYTEYSLAAKVGFHEYKCRGNTYEPTILITMLNSGFVRSNKLKYKWG